MTDYKIGDLVEATFEGSESGLFTVRGRVWDSHSCLCVGDDFLSEATDVKIIERKLPDEPDVDYVIDGNGAVWTNMRPGWKTQYMTYPTSWNAALDRAGTVYCIERGAEVQ
jgi:hypothetical protein